jgi:hypothetical protein
VTSTRFAQVDSTAFSGPPNDWAVHSGYLADLEVVEDGVAIARPSGGFRNPVCDPLGPPFVDAATSAVSFLDPDTLRTQRSIEVSGCVRKLAALPGGDLLMLRGHAKQFGLARLTPTGEVLDVVNLVEISRVAAAIGLLVLPGTPIRLAAVFVLPGQTSVLGQVQVVTSTVDPQVRVYDVGSVANNAAPTAMVSLGNDQLLISDSVTARFLTLDLATGLVDQALGPMDAQDVGAIAYQPEQQWLVMLEPSANGSLYRRDRSRAWVRANVWMSGDPTALGLDDAGGAVVSWMVAMKGRGTSHLGRVDLSTPSLLPGDTLVGDGPVSVLKHDNKGRWFALLPWSTEVVRLDPR